MLNNMTTRRLLLSDLRLACERLLTQAEVVLGPEIDLDSEHVPCDFYWSYDARTAYTMAENPQHEVGSVVDDFDSLVEFLGRPEEETIVWHDLDHLCGLLRMIVFLDMRSFRG
jgi:hypothetical protein